ncbi:MAG: hypothetical protein KF784_07390 [Fimbriimonadaceae bacterium]|nr:hypothetical protein [Fimbriimonadaceae bacterium]
MLTALVALTLFQTPANMDAARYELGERLKVLDVRWMETTDKARRSAAVPQITRAVTAFFSQRPTEAAQALDMAAAVLQGREALPEAGISVRFIPAICEPGKEATLRIWWTYQRADAKPVTIRVAGRSVVCAPGRTLTISINPQKIDRELAMMTEGGTIIAIQVGSLQRTAYLNVVKNARKRIQDLAEAKNPTAIGLRDLIVDAVEKPETMEMDIPIAEQLLLAERLEEGTMKLWQMRDLWRIEHGKTFFRAAFPNTSRVDPSQSKPVNVVIAYHGAGGSENLFFEGYGRGLAVEEAIHRGWIFVAPRVGTTAHKDVIDWLTNVRKLKIGKVFVMGHSMGGAYAAANIGTINPSAVALFAPSSALRRDDVKCPVFLGVGKQELPFLVGTISRMARDLGGLPGFTYEQYDPCEHMMIVAEGAKAAYGVFDSTLAEGVGPNPLY